MSGVEIVPITSTIDTEFTLPSIEEFEQTITDKTRAIFLCNPGNPTGQLYDKEQLQALSDLVKKHDLFLIVDEVYKEFVYEGKFTSVLSLPQIEDHVIVIDSISKVFSACGARVGCLITKNAEVKSSVLKYAQLRLCPPFHGQKLALACYAGTDHYIQSAIQTYQKRREILYNGLSAIPGVTCYKPKAAFYNIAALPVDDAEDFCRWLLTDFRVNKSTVMLAPANGFYFDKALGKSEVRIAYILNSDDLSAAIDILSQALVAYGER
jgi:aspartate aminotransferase